MTSRQKLLNLLGLARRAGELVTGEEQVTLAIQRQKAVYVFIANDASENTRKKITDKCNYYHISTNQLFTSEELSHAIGMSRKVIAIKNRGFAEKMKEKMKELQE